MIGGSRITYFNYRDRRGKAGGELRENFCNQLLVLEFFACFHNSHNGCL